MKVLRGKERERESDPTRSALLPHTRTNPLVFGFSGKTARVKGRSVSNSRLGREFGMCTAWAGVAFSNPRPSPRSFATPVTRSPFQHAGQVWPIFSKDEIKGKGREGFCTRKREGTRLLYSPPASCPQQFAAMTTNFRRWWFYWEN